MSLDALLQATATTLRTTIGAIYNAAPPGGATNYPGDGTGAALSRQQCDVQFEGHPPNSMGQWYISLWESNVDSPERAMLKEIMAFDIFVTVRTGVLPKDRWGTTGMGFSGTWSITAMTNLERDIIQAVHGSQAIRIAANKNLAGNPSDGTLVNADGILKDGTAGDGFSIPPYYMGRPATYAEDGSWIGAQPEKAAFLVRKLHFGGALRGQNLLLMK